MNSQCMVGALGNDIAYRILVYRGFFIGFLGLDIATMPLKMALRDCGVKASFWE